MRSGEVRQGYFDRGYAFVTGAAADNSLVYLTFSGDPNFNEVMPVRIRFHPRQKAQISVDVAGEVSIEGITVGVAKPGAGVPVSLTRGTYRALLKPESPRFAAEGPISAEFTMGEAGPSEIQINALKNKLFPPWKARGVAPTKPLDVRQSDWTGEVPIEIVVDSSGQVVGDIVVGTDRPTLAGAIRSAINRSWEFLPALCDGVPVRSTFKTVLRFPEDFQ